MSSRLFINVPMSPCLECKDLSGLFLSSKQFFANWRVPNKHLCLLPKGAIALKLLCDLYLKTQNKKSITFFVPDYICSSALAYVRKMPEIKLVFFPVSAELRPDWSRIEYLSQHNSPDLFLLVHYFGVKNDLAGAVNFCKQRKCHLIEDAAHVLMSADDIGKYSWATFFCPYKFLALPGGAILQSSVDVEQFIDVENMEYNVDSSLPLRWLCNRVLIKICDLLRVSWPASLPRSHAEGGVIDSCKKEEEKFYKNSIANLLDKYDVKQVKLKRRYNYNKLIHNMRSDDITPVFSKLTAKAIPYVLPIRSTADIAIDLYNKMLKNGIPIQAWPDLPQEVLACHGEHQMAMRLRETINLLPVHQSLSGRHLQKIIRVLDEYK